MRRRHVSRIATVSGVGAVCAMLASVSVPSQAAALDPGDELLITRPARPAADESIYFVMTDRFANGDPTNDTGGVAGDRLVNGFDPTDKAFHHGGDLAGLVASLDYIDALGTTAIWITPPFKNSYVQTNGGPGSASSSYHGYWQVDYTQIDPHYGTNAEMKAFVDAAHARGIKVIFDVVLNHTGDVIRYAENATTYRNKTDFPYRDSAGQTFDDRTFEGTGAFPVLDPATSFPYTPTFAQPADATAKSPAWLNDLRYYHNRGNSTFSGENSQYGDFFGLDDLFTEHPDVVSGMTAIHSDMITEFGIDGFRVDTVKHVSDGFWKAFVPAVFDAAATAGKPDFMIFGEVFGESVEFRSRYSTEFDFEGTLDFGFDAAAKRFASASAPTAELAAFFDSDDWYTDTDSSAHGLAKFIGNHDTGRLGYDVRLANPGAGDAELVDRIELAQALNFLTRGRPVVYYGDEQGFVGDGGDQDARQDMFPSQVATYNDDDLIGTDATTAADNFDPTHPLFVAISDLAELRDAHVALQRGAQINRSSSSAPGVFAFSRIEAGEKIEYLVALNNAEAPASASFATDTSSATWTAIYPAGAASETTDTDGTMQVDLPALGVAVYRADTTIDRDTTATVTAAAPPQAIGRPGISATVDEGYAEVTFAVSVDGGAFTTLGTDDNAPYQLYHDVSSLAVGTPLTYKTIVVDAAGNTASATATSVVAEDVVAPPSALPYAIVHYLRDDGDYGDPSTGNFNDYWGLHLWGEAIDPSEETQWPSPKPFRGTDEYGRFAWIKLADPSKPVNFIVHRGDNKDGTNDDRSFDPSTTPEIWLRQGDPTIYTSHAAAQGYVTIRYQRPDDDYGNPNSTDFNDYWGLHLWGEAIDPSEATQWPSPKKPTRIDADGAYWQIAVDDVTKPVNFIIHRGDNKDPGPDQSFTPADDASVFVQSGDTTIHGTRAAAENVAVIRYHRPDGDYGDPNSSDFNDYWGLHVWAGAASPNPAWQQPVKPSGLDSFGPYWEVPLTAGADGLAYIIHRGDNKDPGPDQFLDIDTYGHEVWQLQGADPAAPYLLPLLGGPVVRGDLGEARAHWVNESTIVWPGVTADATRIELCGAAEGGLTLTAKGVGGGSCVTLNPAGAYPAGVDGMLHLAGQPAFQLAATDLAKVAGLLTGQVAVSASNADGVRVDATGLQIPGVLDDLYATDTPLGVQWNNGTPQVALWAPTAKNVTLQVFDDATSATPTAVPMVAEGGVWRAAGEASWRGRYYLFAVEVYAPSTGRVETNLVTDPYSLSLSMNSTRSQFVDLDDPALAPEQWSGTEKPVLAAPEDLSIYELHVRDFSIFDESVPADARGTFAAFTEDDSNGMRHLESLANAGLTAVHLLPAFDIATIEEDEALRREPDQAVLAGFPADSPEQQRAVAATQNLDGFNWGYDPFHYTTPEGSYSTDPNGSTRITEFREMVQSLNDTGLRVVMDVVYNHTNASGQAATSVLDRIVPGYYHRLDDEGAVATSTCCSNTATEHEMMGRLMIDSVVTWARDYKVDGFRFDLMGHHSKQNMLDLRAALDALTVAEDGVDGSSIYLYGEGWNFGEVANDARFVQATQRNMAGTGIGTFSDRLRDGVRGGGPFDDGPDLVRNQGFINGLWYDSNGGLTQQAALDELLLSADLIRVGLAGNLADYRFVDRTGATVTGAQVDYNGSPAGYTADPQEQIIYIEAHDNQTLFDIGQYHHPVGTTMDERVRAQVVGNAIVALSQGVPFFHAGQDMLRSKSLDRDSFNSGDWFNRLDFTYQSNNWGVGLPIAEKNESNWPIQGPLLADPALAPQPDDIELTAVATQEWLQVRASTPLFRLQTAQDVQERLTFLNTGPSQTPGVIVMALADPAAGAVDLDAELDGLVTLFNATDDPVVWSDTQLAGRALALHPVLAQSVDPVVRSATFDPATGTFTIPARTAAVFVERAPDITPPAVVASLDRLWSVKATGLFRVGAACSDDRPGVSAPTATLNGVSVKHDDIALLITSPTRATIRLRDRLVMFAPKFELKVACSDAAGNTATATAKPQFWSPRPS
jgi:pullulanase-type alpha-1,6-glucosidase